MSKNPINEKISCLEPIYEGFEASAGELKKLQACKPGCSFCCESAGRIDITTLEGMNIRQAMEKMPKSRQKSLTKAFRKEIKLREEDKVAPCPFLMKNKACMIYECRPFSCRRIYSVRICSMENPPAVDKKIMALGHQAITELQALDHTGYSGHLSYILYMLSVPAFSRVYLAGGLKPEQIMDFGRSHGIIINSSRGLDA